MLDAMDSHEWDARYRAAQESGQTVWAAQPNVFVEQAFAEAIPGTAIDLAAGEGRNALWLAAKGWRVTAVDFSGVGLATGRRVATARGLAVEWVVADATNWNPPVPVDVVLIAYLHLPSEPMARVLERAASMLVRGGELFLVGHALENLTGGSGGPQDPDVLYRGDLAVPGLVLTANEVRSRVTAEGSIALDRVLRAIRP